MSTRTRTLTKSKFLHGLQCHKQLYFGVHEPKAQELTVDPATRQRSEHDPLVVKLARERFVGGVLLDYAPWQYRERCDATQAALGADESAIFEASFLEGGVFVAADILERHGRSYHLVDVKSTTQQLPVQVPDVAIQLYVLRAAGVDVSKVEVMRLNPDCHFPDLSNLFVRDDVTEQAEAYLPRVPRQVEQMREALSGELPNVDIGEHCDRPYPCPFKSRCWPELPENHVSTLYEIGDAADTLLAAGINTIDEVPSDYPLPDVAARQVRSVRSGELIIEHGLRAELEKLQLPIAFLHFETIAPPVPVWDGCAPYDAVAVQMSCHVLDAAGGLAHQDYLARGAGDPRPAVAVAVVRACERAKTVLAYGDSFERGCLERLAEAVPAQREALLSLNDRLVDLLSIVRNYVYHPDFGGSFSLKCVLPALVPILSYHDLRICDDATAQAVLERLLLREASVSPEEQDALRQQLLTHCKLDTLAMLKLLQVLLDVA
jgi:hypothetical protein